MAINHFVYVFLNKKFDGGVRVSYSITENVGEPEELKHDIVREALKHYNSNGIEIVSVADIPGGGTGLGSSSSFSVGLLLALNTYFGKPTNRHPCELADAAYYLERGLCGHPVGKQDHYAAAYGGFNYFQFNKDDTTTVQPIRLSRDNRAMLEHRLMLFWVGKTRHADSILALQAKELKDNPCISDYAKEMKNLAIGLNADLQNDRITSVGTFLGLNWQMKRKLALGISNKEIDTYYGKAMEAGASGGKLAGAGGSGFLLFYADYEFHGAIVKALGLRKVPFKICDAGAQVIYQDGLA